MKQEDFQEFLQKYHKEKDHARRRALHHQRVAKRLEWGTIICSTITTVLAFSTLLNAPLIISIIKIITAISSSIVTAIAMWTSRLKTQEKWSFYQKFYHDLDIEYYLYLSNVETYPNFKDKERHFVTRVTSILIEANTKNPGSTLSSTDTEDSPQQTAKV